ncbi:hypothetical protein DDB_G0272518 [Dictyostelium discoideum AX4]|uniref:Uncharacterized protein n=1 Tax=Dictyostelium discoideum TaxID=44689 RepID=Q7KWV8_DICDI|nr:hypothetical protein DDB_G0272518 [Dictyostelium discoideum AX4]EAL71183.1 hypothetical protein DDB_G0272518 [Dictyostelium discoideum AX4]|eukprot:XP_645095.1 hypothetical protein DDB_G0272518 [Dictyostelium discoideum AX4]
METFEKRANEADEIIEQLTKRISQLEQSILNKKKQTIVPTSSLSESVPLSTYEALLKENEKLKQDMEKQNYRINHLLKNMK